MASPRYTLNQARTYCNQSDAIDIISTGLNLKRQLGIANFAAGSFKTGVSAGTIPTDPTVTGQNKYEIAKIQQLASSTVQAPLHSDEVPLDLPIDVAVSITDPSANMTQSLALSPGNDLNAAQIMAANKGLHNAHNSHLTGWWKFHPQKVQQAINTNGIIFGVAGGFLKEAGRIKLELGRINYQNRVGLLIEPITGEELAYYQTFFFAGVRQSARYYEQVPRFKTSVKGSPSI